MHIESRQLVGVAVSVAVAPVAYTQQVTLLRFADLMHIKTWQLVGVAVSMAVAPIAYTHQVSQLCFAELSAHQIMAACWCGCVHGCCTYCLRSAG